jgi:cytochrome c553
MGCIMNMHRAIPRYGQPGLALCLILLGWHAHAQDKASADLHMRANAAMCANCHGSEGRTVNDSAVPPIAGLSHGYIIQEMQAFKEGRRPATVMHQIAKGLSDAQIAALATYFAAQAR